MFFVWKSFLLVVFCLEELLIGCFLFGRASFNCFYIIFRKRAKTCVFCKGDRPSGRCSVITYMEVILLRNHKQCFICLYQGHISQNCLKKNGCYFCKGLHESAICNNKGKKETPENTNVNFSSSGKDFVLLQTAEVNLFNKVYLIY